MKKVKCSNGHFFDADRFATCPSCGAGPIGQAATPADRPIERLSSTQPLMPPAGMKVPPASADLTPDAEKHFPQDAEPLRSADIFQNNKQVPPEESTPQPGSPGGSTELVAAVEATASTNTSPLPKTMAYYEAGEVEPPVGWLICIRGTYVGHAFACKTGRNRIGRNLDMDICLSEDGSISRDTHAVMIYEPKNRVFYLQAGTGSGLTYHNGSLVFDHSEIHSHDKIELGKTEFIFLPLCGENFTWDDYMTKG